MNRHNAKSGPTVFQRSPGRGFTLVELVIVMVVVGVVSAIAVPRFSSAHNKSLAIDAANSLKVMNDALEHYAMDKGHYPYPGNDENKYSEVVENELLSLAGGNSPYLQQIPQNPFKDSYVPTELFLIGRDPSPNYVWTRAECWHYSGSINDSRPREAAINLLLPSDGPTIEQVQAWAGNARIVY